MHPRDRLFMTVYIDDVKLVGSSSSVKSMRRRIAEVVLFEPPTSMERDLGCTQRSFETNMSQVVALRNNLPGISKSSKPNEERKLKVMEYDVMSLTGQCLHAYESLAGGGGGGGNGNFQPCKRAQTPFLPEDSLPVGDDESKGVLAAIELKVLMMVLYVARIGRDDILRATTALAKQGTKWNKNCARQLRRLMSYLNQSESLKTYGGRVQDSRMALFFDAALAGDKSDCRSTSGVCLAIVVPATYFPLSAICKKQGCVSDSTYEAEVVAMTYALEQEGLPVLATREALVSAARPLATSREKKGATGPAPQLRSQTTLPCRLLRRRSFLCSMTISPRSL